MLRVRNGGERVQTAGMQMAGGREWEAVCVDALAHTLQQTLPDGSQVAVGWLDGANG